MSKKRADASEQYSTEYIDIYDHYTNIAMNRFKWNTGEQGFKGKQIERSLYDFGQVCFFNDKELGLMALPYQDSNGLNVYGEPTFVRVMGFNSFSKVLSVDDVVLLKNNYTGRPTNRFIRNRCLKIANLEGAITTNVEGQKTPYIIQANDKTLLSLKNIYRDKELNVPVIYVDKDLNIKETMVFSTIAPYVADKLNDQKVIYQNEIMTYLGINNSNIDKKERVLVDETNANNQVIMESLDVLLDRRKAACEDIKAKFGVDISVDVRKELYTDGNGGTEETDRTEL